MRPTVIAASAAAALTLLAGCGAPASPTTAAPPASGPASTPAETSTTPAAPAGEVSVDEFIQRVKGAQVKTFTSVMDIATEIEGAPMEMKISGSYDISDPKKPASHLKMDVSGMAIEIIMLDGEAYLKMDLLGDQWMRTDPDTAAQMAGGGAPNLGQWAEDYGKYIQSVEKVGEDTVDGVAVTHYRLKLSPEALSELGGGSDIGEVTSIDYEVWVDADGFTRKFAVDMPGETPVKMNATMSDINQPVSIKAPKDWVEMPS